VPQRTRDDPVLRTAVVGGGKISEEHLRFLQRSDLTELAAVCDRSGALARFAAERFGARSHHTDLGDLLARVKPDVVHVLTPPSSHVPLITASLEAGAHVISEKPLAPTHAQFLELCSLAEARGRRLVEDHNYRFNEPILAMESLVKEGRLGDVKEVEVRMCLHLHAPGNRYGDANLPHPSHRLPAGVIHEFITHLSYLALRFVPDFDKVTAAWRNHRGGDLFRYDDLDALVSSSDRRARIRFSASTWPECFTMTVRGTSGTVSTDLFQPHLLVSIPRTGGPQLSPLVNHWSQGWSLIRASFRGFKDKILQKTPYEGLHTFLGRTYEALATGESPPVSITDMVRTSELVEALLCEVNQV
jgi:predicted dehydrogenase